jgi:hypothetical protein
VAVVPAAIVNGISGSLIAAARIPSVPRSVDETQVGTAELQGFNPPDPSDWFPSIVVPRTPEGSGCFDSIVRLAGRLDLCWEGYRDNRESLPGADVYHFRLLATLHDADPMTWVSITVSPAGGERVLVSQVWPNGVVDGPCRTITVEGMNFLTDGSSTNDVVDDAVCGRTTSVRTTGWKAHHITWTCGDCGASTQNGPKIALRQLIHTDEGQVPTWAIAAEIGR